MPVAPAPALLATNDINTMPDTLNLMGWVLGDDPQRIFPVKIANSETVGALKKAIKDEKKPEFDDYVTDLLVLWKVSNASLLMLKI